MFFYMKSNLLMNGQTYYSSYLLHIALKESPFEVKIEETIPMVKGQTFA
jgi:hypothetical protein